MKHIVIHQAGGYENLKLETAPDPRPGADEVVVRSSAAGVNYADACVRWGVYESAKKFVGWPITPGFEFAGEVAEVGAGVTHVQPGDQVFGVTLFNGYSSHVKVPKTFVWKRPRELSVEQAAGFPAVFFTAYHGLLQNVRIYPGMAVMIHSAAGGVGSALVQLAKLHGLKVVAVVGASHKVEYVKSLGADVIIDKSKQNLWQEAKRAVPQGYDLIFDANGPETMKQGYAQLRATGKLVVYGFHTLLPKQGGRINYLKAAWGMVKIPRFNPLTMTNQNKSLVAFNLSFLFERDDLIQEAARDLLLWLSEGKLRPPKVQTFAFENVAAAHQAIESGQTTGKLILTMN
jgi:NADPH:quinone reductase-like Zn-dependent oxidoreductase